jgi:hypothetical protein
MAGMSGMGLRRAVGILAALAWPACRLFETITHPPWGSALSDAVAPLVGCVMLALVLTSPAAQRKHAQPRHARPHGLAMELVATHLLHLSSRVGDLSLRQERCEADQELIRARLDCYGRVINEANQVAGLPAPDMDETLPGTRKLRAVRLRQPA